MTSRRIPPDPVVDRLPDQAIRITVGKLNERKLAYLEAAR